MTDSGPPSAAGPTATAQIDLAGEFEPSTWEQWLHTAAKALKRDLGPDDDPAAVVAKLRSTTYDGIVIEPLYTAEHHAASAAPGLPGTAPLVRGRTAAATREHGWDVRQRVIAGSDGPSALDELECGATSVWLDVTRLDPADPVAFTAALSSALDGVLFDLAGVVLDAGERWAEAARPLIQLWRSSPDLAAVTGNLGADPIGELAERGGNDASDAFAAAIELVRVVQTDLAGVRVFAVDATRYHDAGATDADELALGIAAGLATVRAMADAGIDLDTAFAQIEFRLAATADQFATIAKFRAARRLWSRIAEVCGVAEAAASTPLHAVTSRAMMSRHDPWVNLLRGTTACFGAGVGGADAITVLPYDEFLGGEGGSELGRRIARNTQSILAKESNLARVIDPGGGSWFVESFTAQLAEAAWQRFQQIEGAGGIVAAIADGSVAAGLDAAWQARRKNLVTRRDPLTGVSEFPNVMEAPVDIE
ncbi:MAG TPA: methylmalonyl-CoA mutase subunit beta, partial [Ilumatobacteraceae bacterium]|nr:methylmalonyl-CoA mutase subunit beta [Ilumatobacteraceae bacterium]